MDLRDRRVIITGGAGALGTAVVEALLAAGATCHIPCFDAAEAQRFALRTHERVVLTVTGSLAEEAAVASLYDGVAPLWASIADIPGPPDIDRLSEVRLACWYGPKS